MKHNPFWKPTAEDVVIERRFLQKVKRKRRSLDERWARIRKRVFNTYGKYCMRCGRTEKVMHVDHIKAVSRYPELRYAFDNLQVLCPDCNVRKGVMTIDFRPQEIDLTPEQRQHMAEILL